MTEFRARFKGSILGAARDPRGNDWTAAVVVSSRIAKSFVSPMSPSFRQSVHANATISAYAALVCKSPIVTFTRHRNDVRRPLWKCLGERCGVLQAPEDKDAALFPVTFDDHWALIHRPVPVAADLGAHIWLSVSPDLHYWGEARTLLTARRGGWWDANEVGLGPPFPAD